MDANILVSLANVSLINEAAISSNILVDSWLIQAHSCQAFCVVRWKYWPRTGDENAAFDRKTCWYSQGRGYEVGEKCWRIFRLLENSSFQTWSSVMCCSTELAFSGGDGWLLYLGSIWHWTLSPWNALSELDFTEKFIDTEGFIELY